MNIATLLSRKNKKRPQKSFFLKCGREDRIFGQEFKKSYFQKYKSSAQSLNFDWILLVNELILTFTAPIKCTKAQLNLKILSRVMPHTTYYRQTDTFVKTVFLTQGVSKRNDLMKISKVIFHKKPIPSHMMRMYKI